MKENKALHIISMISTSILVMLFFLFMTTFDFASKNKSDEYLDGDEITNVFGNLIQKSMDESNDMNVLSFEIGERLASSVLYSMIKKEEQSTIYQDLYWTVNRIIVGFDNGKVVLDIHASYHKTINYNMKIRAYLDFKEDDLGFTLSLYKLKIGAYYIRKSLVERIFVDSSDDSIGLFINNVISTFKVGTFDKESISFTIKKTDISDYIENGNAISKLFEDSKENIRIAAFYFGMMFENNLVSLSISDSIRIKIDYSKFLNNSTTTTFDDENEKILKMSKEELEAYKNEIVLKYFLQEKEIDVDLSVLNSLLLLKSGASFEQTNKYIYLKKMHLSVFESEIRLSFVYNVFNKESKIDVIYELRDDAYYVKQVEVGRDPGESHYILITSTTLINEVLSSLSYYGIGSDSFVSPSTIESFIEDAIPAKQKSYSPLESIVLMTIQDDPMNAVVSSVIRSDAFSEYIKNELPDFDSSSNEAIISSYISLSAEKRNIYFTKIKNFLKSETSVYNYIIKILNEEQTL